MRCRPSIRFQIFKHEDYRYFWRNTKYNATISKNFTGTGIIYPIMDNKPTSLQSRETTNTLSYKKIFLVHRWYLHSRLSVQQKTNKKMNIGLTWRAVQSIKWRSMFVRLGVETQPILLLLVCRWRCAAESTTKRTSPSTRSRLPPSGTFPRQNPSGSMKGM
jgi:hypothetical protein